MQRLFGKKMEFPGDTSETEDLSTLTEKKEDTAKNNAFLLKKRWEGADDTIGHRLVNKILRMYKASNPEIIALLKDDCISFEKTLEATQQTALFLLEAACLCGAEKITHYVLNNINIDFKESNETIAYALSAKKKDLALTVAKYAKAHGQVTTGNIYLYNNCKYSDLKEIENIFNNNPILRM